MPFLLRAYFFMPILYKEVAHMERPVTEEMNKAFVHMPNIAEEFTEVYV
jgi:hypothetical protein